MADQAPPDVTAAPAAAAADTQKTKAAFFSCGKSGSRLPRYFASSGFTFSILCFALCFVYYLFLSGWSKLDLNTDSFFFKLFCKIFGAEELVAAISNAAELLGNMYTALWVMGISAVTCFISGFPGCSGCRIAGFPIALAASLVSFLGAAAFLLATWHGFDCWYLGAVPCALYGLSGLFAVINALR